MNRLSSVLREVWHLFVDDGVFAAAIVVWPALVWLAQTQIGLATGWAPALLFGGLVIILVAGAVIRARPIG